MQNGNNIKYRVGVLEKCQAKIEERLDSIMENHLPHIQQDLATLKTRITTMTAINVGAIIVAIILSFIFR